MLIMSPVYTAPPSIGLLYKYCPLTGFGNQSEGLFWGFIFIHFFFGSYLIYKWPCMYIELPPPTPIYHYLHVPFPLSPLWPVYTRFNRGTGINRGTWAALLEEKWNLWPPEPADQRTLF